MLYGLQYGVNGLVRVPSTPTVVLEDSQQDGEYFGPLEEVLERFDSPSTNPNGLTFDGTNLISSDTATDKIYVQDGVS